MILMNSVWNLCLISFFCFFVFPLSIFLLLPIKGCSRFKMLNKWTCKKTMHDLKHPVCMHATWPAIRLGICNYSVGQVSPTMSRRVILVRLWRCQGPGSLGRQRRSSEMKSLGLWPHLMPHSNVCILHKTIDLFIFGHLLDKFFSVWC